MPAALTGGLLTTSCIAELFDDWRGPAESWLFVSPHDDDIVLGGGLIFQVGIAEGVQVHAAVVTDGRMGYCRIEQRDSIAAIRAEEAKKSFAILGLPPERLHFLGFPDGQPGRVPRRLLRQRRGGPGRRSRWACRSPSRGCCGRCGRRGSSCPPVPICTPTTASSTKS